MCVCVCVCYVKQKMINKNLVEKFNTFADFFFTYFSFVGFSKLLTQCVCVCVCVCARACVCMDRIKWAFELMIWRFVSVYLSYLSTKTHHPNYLSVKDTIWTLVAEEIYYGLIFPRTKQYKIIHDRIINNIFIYCQGKFNGRNTGMA